MLKSEASQNDSWQVFSRIIKHLFADFIYKINTKLMEPEEIFAGSLWEAEIIQGLLNTGGIEAYVQDDVTGTIAPWRMTTSDVESVKLVVSKEEADQAKEIIAEYRK